MATSDILCSHAINFWNKIAKNKIRKEHKKPSAQPHSYILMNMFESNTQGWNNFQFSIIYIYIKVSSTLLTLNNNIFSGLVSYRVMSDILERVTGGFLQWKISAKTNK